ncbi:cell wall hydrolase [Paenibacillus prosopidis]|uniref:Copper amine oxidase-like protein n=1 Tax=Paenibacillus prosopidis TaxID=630520 RepID=A0A368W1J3_9BACL|nr:cell wall hydrolase [Paenibacillus prosopidis]RCW48897.1 copper amine oxidase-like protein [Paenibacillus prosopidis]
MIRSSKLNGKRMLIMLWAMLLLCIGPLSAAAAQGEKAAIADDVTIKLDGKALKIADPVRMLEGRLFLPVANIAGMFGAKVNWDNENEEATIHTVLGDQIVLGNGVPVVYFNEGRYVMEVAPFLSDGRMYIPLRHAVELMHAQVKWNTEELAAELTTVLPAVVTEAYGLAEISNEAGSSTPALLQRNGLDSKSGIKEGTRLRVVMPSILDNKAEPFTEKDLMLLAQITQVESGYESYEGQLGVANVILNRVKDSRFPDTIQGVIYSGKQFPPAHNGLLEKSKPNASVLRAAKDALNGKNNVEKAVYFFNPNVSKGSFWSSLKVIATIDHHSFAK